jgi:hypothetical protein
MYSDNESEGFEYIDRWGTKLPEKWEANRETQISIWILRQAKRKT